MRKFVVKKSNTLLGLLGEAGYSRTKVKQLLKYKAIILGKASLKRDDHPLNPGDEIVIKTAEEMREEALVCPGLTIVYEDETIVVINKPTGLLSIASATEKRKTAYFMLSAYMKERSQSTTARIFVVHRLDRDTSGLLVFAKSEPAKHSLQSHWSEAEKKYFALVEGIPKNSSGTITSRLRESKALRVYSVREDDDDIDARSAVTTYKVVKSGNGYSLLEVVPITGRKNQIRVHLADLGHPVVGDKKYGAKTNPLGRLALHSAFLAFPHPDTGKRLEFKAAMPGKFNTVFTRPTSTGDNAPHL